MRVSETSISFYCQTREVIKPCWLRSIACIGQVAPEKTGKKHKDTSTIPDHQFEAEQ
jgi:hypothetical protein